MYRLAGRQAYAPDDPAVAAVRARIEAIVAEAERTGMLNEAALAELPPQVAEQLRAAWVAQGGT
jgi:hypothetical protein